MKRVALVTGGSRGIGEAICKMLTENGVETIAPDRAQLDLLSAESILAFLESQKDRAFDILINNAGSNDIHLTEEITDDEIERMTAVNFLAPLRLTRGIIPNMKARGYGRIVNIGSIWGVVSKPGRALYSMTKHGIHGLTKTLSSELAPYNILVNTVCPGFTLTELTRKNNSPEQIEAIAAQIPMGRMAQPEEIAMAVCFLVSEQNTYITGQRLTVDGGYTSI